MTPKKLGIIAVALFLLLGIAYLVTPKKHHTTKKNTTPAITAASQSPGVRTTPAMQALAKEKDKKKQANMQEMLTLIANAYSKSGGGYPEGSAQGWKQITQNVTQTDAFVDPFTNAYYAFTGDADPDYGQIQYKPAATCDGDHFTGAGYRSIAIRTRLSTGVVCAHIESKNNLSL